MEESVGSVHAIENEVHTDDLESNNTNREELETRIIKIHRDNVRADLIEEFKDPSIVSCDIIVEMINHRGVAEKGRGTGVFKDTLALFWKDVYDSLMLGEDERVPFVRDDFQRQEWESVARILLKGFRTCQYFPLRLSRPFIVSCLFGEDSVSTDLLFDSFKHYVSEVERKVIERCRSGTIEANDESLLDLLSNFDCRRNVTKDTSLKIFTELAHKELIQRPQYVADCWGEILVELKPSFPNVEALNQLYIQLTPTTSKILNAMVCQPLNEGERQSEKYLKRFIKGLDSRLLSTFLRFFSGSDLMLFATWQVHFTNLLGASRRPIAHTCSCTLELPSTYQSFPELREEFNNILQADNWEMDIL